MNTKTFLKYFESTFSIPVGLYSIESLDEKNSDKLDIPLELIRPYVTEDTLGGVVVSPLFIMCGYIKVPKSNEFILVGPVSINRLTKKQIQQFFLSQHISLALAEEFSLWFQKVPTMYEKKFQDILNFLNITINEVPIQFNRFSFQESKINSSPTNIKLDPFSSFNYEFEKKIFTCIRFGKVTELQQLQKEVIHSSDVSLASLANTDTRSFKNTFIAGSSVAARAAISGGVDSSVALSLSDYYISTVEKLDSFTDINRLLEEMLLDFAKRVAKTRDLNSDSATVVAIIRYVHSHLYSKLSTTGIAESLQLSSSYISRHFKEKTGITITEYIHQQKIIEAQFLLTTTDYSVLHISEALAFSSQPYFQTIFKKYTHQTPTFFRNNLSTDNQF